MNEHIGYPVTNQPHMPSSPGGYGDPGSPLQPQGRLGLAIASLVLGVLAVVLSFLLVGGVLGVVGLILGFVHLKKRRRPNGMACWGVGLSVAGIIAGIGFGVLYYPVYKAVRKVMEARGSGPSATEWQGVAAPDFTVTALDGKKMTLSELKGKRVVLDFWATWCPPCRREIPHFIQLAKDIPSSDLCIVGISREDEAKLNGFAQEEGINYPIASAKDLPAPYSDVRSIPTTFFIDRHGIIQTVAVGYHDLATLKSHATEKDYEGKPKSPPAPKSGTRAQR
jgi:peroxiredoxin